MDTDEKRIAVLIDADNVSADYVGPIFDEISNHGSPTIKRIYGDWTQPSLGKWKATLLEYSIIPIQQYSYTSGKNATDSALIIDAMDILYGRNTDGFCIVSSDSDFTRLASRLRESGKMVIGMGEKKTPAAFVNACEQFKYLEVLMESGKDDASEDEEKVTKVASKSPGPTRAVLSKAIGGIVDDIGDAEGWAPLGAVGQRLNTRYPAFDSRNYGFKKLSQLVDSFPRFEVLSKTLPGQHEAQTFIRIKEAAKKEKAKKAAAKKEAANASATATMATEAPAKKTATKTTKSAATAAAKKTVSATAATKKAASATTAKATKKSVAAAKPATTTRKRKTTSS